MMQHTQTHRHHHSVNNSSNSNDSSSMQSKSRAQQRRSSMSKIKDEARKPAALSVDTTSLSHENTYGGLVSPVSLGSPKQWDEMPASPKRRLSVADLCNPPEEYQVNLTPDEYEALEGFARFHENPIFFDSLRNLAAAACIEHRIWIQSPSLSVSFSLCLSLTLSLSLSLSLFLPLSSSTSC